MGRKKKNEEVKIATLTNGKNGDEYILGHTDTLAQKSEIIDDIIDEEDDNDSNIKKGEILVGNNFKIVVTKRYNEIYEKKKVKIKDENGVEIEVEMFKSHNVYVGRLRDAFDHIRSYMSKNRIYEKGTINSLSEAIEIIKKSDEQVRKMFEGINI